MEKQKVTSHSQEVGYFALKVPCLSGLTFHGMENFELLLEGRSHVEERSNVAATVAIVWCRPDSNQVALLEPILEAIHHQLVSSSHKVQSVDLVKLAGNFVTKEPACTAR